MTSPAMADDKPHFASVGELIRFLLQNKRVTADELSKKMRVTHRYLSQLELGRIQPTIQQIELLQSYL